MSKQSETGFISEIDLTNYPPFKDEGIKLKGENEIQALIKFYLENKKIINSKKSDIDPEKNSKRFKINCIVGENGVGKSRFFKKIIKQKRNKKEIKSEVLWDDFFLLEENLHVSEKYLTNVNKGVFNNFKSLSNDGLGFNWYMNGVIFFNLLFDNIILKQFWGREIDKDNIEFAHTKIAWFLPFNKSRNSEASKPENWNQSDCMKAANQLLKKILNGLDDLNNHSFWSELQCWKDLKENRKNLKDEQDHKKKINLINDFFTKTLYACNVKFDDWTTLSSLSAGEKVTLLRFTNIYMNILEKYNNWKTDFLILIDEPDLHLHLDWQRQYIQKLIDVFATLSSDIKLHFVIATHSPFLISDLPTECIIALKKDDKRNTEVLELKKNSTFWANFVDLIRNGFFFKDQMLMWSFAEEIIKQIAENDRKEILENNANWISKKKKRDLEEREKLKEFIGDDFLRDNLLYFKP